MAAAPRSVYCDSGGVSPLSEYNGAGGRIPHQHNKWTKNWMCSMVAFAASWGWVLGNPWFIDRNGCLWIRDFYFSRISTRQWKFCHVCRHLPVISVQEMFRLQQHLEVNGVQLTPYRGCWQFLDWRDRFSSTITIFSGVAAGEMWAEKNVTVSLPEWPSSTKTCSSVGSACEDNTRYVFYRSNLLHTACWQCEEMFMKSFWAGSWKAL